MRWVPLTTMCWMIVGAGAAGCGAAAGGGARAAPGPGNCAQAGRDRQAPAASSIAAGAARDTRANRAMWLHPRRLWYSFMWLDRRCGGVPKFQKRFRRTRSFQVARSINPSTNSQPKPKSDVLGPLTERTPQNSFACIVQKMAPVEQRNRKKIDQPNAYGK